MLKYNLKKIVEKTIEIGECTTNKRDNTSFAVTCFLVLQLIFLSFDTALADEPSFDCTKAATPVEKLICGSPELSDLDSLLSRHFKILRTVLNGRGEKKLQIRQALWLKKRDKECKKIIGKEKKEQYLQSLYKNRTAELDGLRNDFMDYRPAFTEKYPDKWGMQLPLPQTQFVDGNNLTVNLYINQQNDLIVSYYQYTSERAFKVRYISFFTGKILKEINYPKSVKSNKDNSIECYEAENNFIGLPRLYYLTDDYHKNGMLLRDGGRLIRKSKSPGGHCDRAIAHWFIKYDKNGKEIFQKAIVRVTEKPRRFFTSTECSIMDGSDDGTSMVHSKTILPETYELPDGTYIVIEFEGPTIIRLKKDFTSPYIDNSDELLFMDAKKMFKKYDEVFSDVLHSGDRKDKYGFLRWHPEQLEWCNIKIECINIKMTEYFKDLIAKKRR